MSAAPFGARRFAAIAIGASAGGVEALGELLPALRRGLDAAVFVVVHLPRERRSILPEIFAARCALDVEEAGDKVPVRPGHVYFAPPDYHLLLDDGPSLALSVDDAVQYSRPSIDVMFESAADVYGSALLAILLTGGNEDGASGLHYVAGRGGACLVQDPDEALASAMPRAALRRMTPHAVLRLGAMAALLSTLNSEENA